MKIAPCFFLVVVLTANVAKTSVTDEPVDSRKLHQLHQKVNDGQALTAEEHADYERGKAARKKGEQLPAKTSGPPVAGKAAAVGKPLTDMTAGNRYKGEDGGLYGAGRNTPPDAHLKAALADAAKIQPLDAEGRPSSDGKVVFMTMGMSNTTLESQEFAKLAIADAQRSQKLVVLDGSRAGETGASWARSLEQDRKTSGSWATAMERLKAAGVSPRQVQVVWAKMAEANPADLGEFPTHAKKLHENTRESLRLLKQYCPNVRIVHVSSRTYGGYTHGPLNPEPYAYESAFAMRWLIQEQLSGAASLDFHGGKFPLLLWGPYLWAAGATPRADGFAWSREDYKSGGIHVTDSGAKKVAVQLLKFFKTDPTAAVWFLKH